VNTQKPVEVEDNKSEDSEKSKEEEEVVNTKSDKIYVSELLKQKFADNEVAKFLE